LGIVQAAKIQRILKSKKQKARKCGFDIPLLVGFYTKKIEFNTPEIGFGYANWG
jgi:hypothetical protein